MTYQYKTQEFATTITARPARKAAPTQKPNYNVARIHETSKIVDPSAFRRIVDSMRDKRFNNLADELLQETAYLSSPSAVMRTQSFRGIVALGDFAARKILRRLLSGDVRLVWLHALRSITGVNPVPAESAGIVQEMGRCWIKWGHERGLV